MTEPKQWIFLDGKVREIGDMSNQVTKPKSTDPTALEFAFTLAFLGTMALVLFGLYQIVMGGFLSTHSDLILATSVITLGISVSIGAYVGFNDATVANAKENAEAIKTAAELILFAKNVTQMENDELWKVVKSSGETSEKGAIAMTELKSRNISMPDTISDPNKQAVVARWDGAYNGPDGGWKRNGE